MKKLFGMIATALAGLCSGCAPGGTDSKASAPAAKGLPGVEHVDAAGAARLVETGSVVVLDVRTPQEYAAAHIRGAQLVDFRAPDFVERLSKLDRDRTYLVHCASGGRSTQSLATFRELGFTRVVHLDGGFNAWKAAGNPVEK